MGYETMEEKKEESRVLELPVDIGAGLNDYTFKFKKLKPSKSLKFLLFMGKFIGRGGAGVVGSFDGQVNNLEDVSKIKESDINFKKMGEALIGALEVDEDDVIVKLDLLLGSVTFEGEPLHVDHTVFEADLSLLPKIAMKALAVNYKSFLGGSSDLFSKIVKSINIVKNGKSYPTET